MFLDIFAYVDDVIGNISHDIVKLLFATGRWVDKEIPQDKYPKITERIGDSPPQYIDWNEEDEDFDEDKEVDE